MARIARNILDLIGHTPLLEASRYSDAMGCGSKIIVKLEKFNPAGSIKDRVAVAMVDDAVERGVISEGSTIIEPTSGNTGIGLAMVAMVKKMRLILTMPETMSEERRKLLKAMGAELVLTPASEGMKGAIRKAEEINDSIEGSVILGQFSNKANPQAHYDTTAVEIWDDTDGEIDILVVGIGTAGTISGIGRYLKEMNKTINIVGVEPADSAVINGGKPAPHAIQGIGAGFIPDNYDASVVDFVYTVSNEAAISSAKLFSRTEGILVGISSGAALAVAARLGSMPDNIDKNIVVILPDTGDRYLSTNIFE